MKRFVCVCVCVREREHTLYFHYCRYYVRHSKRHKQTYIIIIPTTLNESTHSQSEKKRKRCNHTSWQLLCLYITLLQEEPRACREKDLMLLCIAGQTARHTGKEEVLTNAWVEAWSIAATDKDVLGSMSSNASSMFS